MRERAHGLSFIGYSNGYQKKLVSCIIKILGCFFLLDKFQLSSFHDIFFVVVVVKLHIVDLVLSTGKLLII